MASFLLFLSCFDSFLYWVSCATQAEIDQHLQLGMNLLARGAYSDALSHFHAAVDADPGTYHDYVELLKLYDKNSNGTMMLAELENILANLGDEIPKEDVQKLFAE